MDKLERLIEFLEDLGLEDDAEFPWDGQAWEVSLNSYGNVEVGINLGNPGFLWPIELMPYRMSPHEEERYAWKNGEVGIPRDLILFRETVRLYTVHKVSTSDAFRKFEAQFRAAEANTISELNVILNIRDEWTERYIAEHLPEVIEWRAQIDRWWGNPMTYIREALHCNADKENVE